MDRLVNGLQKISLSRFRSKRSSLEQLLDSSGDPTLVEALRLIAPFEIKKGLTRIDAAPRALGGYGEIYQGELKNGKTVRKVAIKRLRWSEDMGFARLLTRHAREIRLWSSLGHQNVLQFIGFEIKGNPDEATLVCPWMENGDLKTYLKGKPYSRQERLLFVRDTLDGLMYLHARGVCHGDLKAANVLVTPEIRGVLCDFGLARFIKTPGHGNMTTSNSYKGTVHWTSPEQLNSEVALLTPSADTWSWGMMTLEIMTGEIPYCKITIPPKALHAISNGVLPDAQDYPLLPRNDALWGLFHGCWKNKPEERSTLADLREQIMLLLFPKPTASRQREDAMDILGLEISSYRELSLANDDRDISPRKLATALVEYGRYLTEAGRHADALPPHEEAVRLWKGLVARHPGAFELQLTESMQQLSENLAVVGRRKEALDQAQEGCDMLQTLGEKDPEAFRSAHAVSLRILSDRLADTGRRDEALEMADEAVHIYTELGKQSHASSQEYIPFLLSFSSRLGDVGRRADALKQARAAYALVSALTEDASDQYQSTLASCLDRLCDCEGNKANAKDALGHSERAAKIWRKLVEKDPQAFRPKLAASLTAYETWLNDGGFFGDALSVGTEGVAMWRGLVEQAPRSYSPGLSGALFWHSMSLWNVGRYESALEYSQEAVVIQERLADEHLQRFLPDLGVWCRHHSDCLKQGERLEEAIKAAKRAVDILRPFADNHPDAFRSQLSRALNALSDCLLEDGKPEDALPHLRAAVELDKGFRGPGPASRLRALATCLSDLGENDDALQPVEKAVDMARKWAGNHLDAMSQGLLALSLVAASDCLMKCGRSDDAIQRGRESMDIFERLAEQEPESFLPNYTRASNNLVGKLRHLNRSYEALQITTRIADLHRQLSG